MARSKKKTAKRASAFAIAPTKGDTVRQHEYVASVLREAFLARPEARGESMGTIETSHDAFDAITRLATGITRASAPAQVERQLSASETFTCTLHTCPKCKARQSYYVEKQTRSSDEPMTLFITCVCGHKWRK